VVTCHTRAEAQRALAEATALLKTLGVTSNADKTRIVQVKVGFEFLGYRQDGSTALASASQQDP
jgi:hypothetical protein